MKHFFLISIGLTTLLFPNFSKVGNIVTDNSTGLQWQDNEDARSNKKSWKEAIDYCEALSLDGYSDWRLPNIKELTSLVDDTKIDCAIDKAFEFTTSGNNEHFGGSGYNIYWSSTTSLDAYKDFAWYIDFYYGYQMQGPKGPKSKEYVRCVRDANLTDLNQSSEAGVEPTDLEEINSTEVNTQGGEF